MIKQAILNQNQNQNQNQTKDFFNITTINTTSILLLLSVKNADKESSSVDCYLNRIDLICHMADYISNELGIECSVGLTQCSLFADKAKVIDHWLNNESKNSIEKYYLVGFDTITRLFDAKYYSDSVENSLDSFFKNNSVVVLLRDDGKVSIDDQVEYFNSISIGTCANIPSKWMKKIFITQSPSEWGISSSNIRKMIANGDCNWQTMVIPSIKSAILDSGLYGLRNV